MTGLLLHYVLPAMRGVLPAKMDSAEARAMLLAIALQESRASARRQQNFGPARGLWQFELGGVRGVMKHPSTRSHARDVLRLLHYDHLIGAKNETSAIHQVLEHNDLLAAAFARLNLWWLPNALPHREQMQAAWSQYLAAWNPGEPHFSTWPAYHEQAWALLEESGYISNARG